MPLWADRGTGSIVDDLAISRSQSGALPLTPEEWSAILEEAGGWPTEGAWPRRAWSLLSVDPADRSEDPIRGYASGARYDDLLGSHYSYDNRVPNHRNLQVGDVVVVRDSKLVLGLGRVTDIDDREGSKVVLSCPECGRTDVAVRTTRTPAYRCGLCRAEFEEPVVGDVPVTQYRADYGETWSPFDEPLPVTTLERAYLRSSRQNSIRPLDLDVLQRILSEDPFLLDVGSNLATAPDDSPLPGGTRTGLGRIRVGQQRFREEMIDRFGLVCAITGPQPHRALEAAHLYSYAERPEHDPRGGLLLRRDLHALFDGGLITIDPEGWTVQLAPELESFPQLWALRGKTLAIEEGLRPNSAYLRNHCDRARDRWGSA